MPFLLPAPRSATWTGGPCHPEAPLTAVVDAELPVEGYKLTITADAVAIRHRDPAGLRHAQATLAQLRQQGPVPCGSVTDAPAFAVRGLMLDCSRDRIPTMASLRTLLHQMAAWKLNHLQLYCEHAVSYRGHEVVSAAASPLTLDELAILDREAGDLGIALSANQNCFGHLERWFRHGAYEPLAELPGDPGHHHHSGCRTLAPSHPGSLALVRDLVAQQAAVLRAPVFNIGGDETWDLGKGRSKDLIAREGYHAVYGRFLGQVMAAARANGKVPAFWADMLLHHPEAAQHLDRSAIALDWGYSGRHDFAASQQKLAAAGFAERWVCPGTSCWSSFGGNSDERRANLYRAARDGLKHGAVGFLVTCWGDGGHRQIWPASLVGIAEAAHRSWSGTAQYDPQAGGLFATGCAALGPYLDALGQVDRPLRDGARWETPFKALHGSWKRHPDIPWAMRGPTIHPDLSAPSEWQAVIAQADDLRSRIPAGCDPQIADECRLTLDFTVLGAERGIEAIGGAARPATWDARLQVAIAEHRRQWLLRSRPGGLDDSVGAFTAPLG
jgi:hexosaminidase